VRPLVNALLRQLDALISLVETNDDSSWYRSELLELKKKLEEAKKPLIPSRSLWNKYIRIYSTVEELINTTKTHREKIHLYRVLPGVREDLLDFTESLKKAYLLERIQLGLPIIMCLAVTILRLIEVFSDFTLVSFLFSVTALLLLFYSPQIGLIMNGTSGFLIAVKSNNISDVFLGLFLSTISLAYVVIVVFTGSRKFSSRVEELIKNISLSVELEFKQEPRLKTENIMCLVKNYGVDTSGFLRYVDYEELLKYKASVVLIHGQVVCTTSTELISDSTTSEKQE
jgi:hypothetical protein